MIRNDPNSEVNVPLLTLMRRLDVEHEIGARIPAATTASGLAAPTMNDEDHTSYPSRHPSPSERGLDDAPRPSDLVERCLDRAVLAFTARWFPLHLHAIELDKIVTNSWRCSRADMVVLLNQVSYRSMLALYLFAQTPVPVGIPEEEELGGITGPVCMHTALMHIQKMRQRCDPGKFLKA
jgi:hypothetical protein